MIKNSEVCHLPYSTRIMVNNFWLLSLFTVVTFTLGCPTTPPGGDPAIDQTMTFEGQVFIKEVVSESPETSLSIQWIWSHSGEKEETAHVIKMDEIQDLPEDFVPQVGETIPLIVTIEWNGKASVGPPQPFAPVKKRTLHFHQSQ